MNTITNRPGGLHEKEEHRLQRDADSYTENLEFTKKKYLISED
jgi:hypothetical protein